MTPEEKVISFETLKHIRLVATLLNKIAVELIHRVDTHDQSKLEEPELSTFVEYTPKLANSTFGSKEYKSFLKRTFWYFKSARIHFKKYTCII